MPASPIVRLMVILPPGQRLAHDIALRAVRRDAQREVLDLGIDVLVALAGGGWSHGRDEARGLSSFLRVGTRRPSFGALLGLHLARNGALAATTGDCTKCGRFMLVLSEDTVGR